MTESPDPGAPIVSTRIGDIALPDVESDIIGRHVARYGEWAWNEILFVADQLAEGARILDAGAFVGTFGLGVSSLKDAAFICFIEANGRVAPLLQENVARLRGRDDVVVEAILAGTQQPASSSGRSDSGNLGSTSYAVDATGDVAATAAATAVTLAQIRAQHGPFDLIKLDVEGLEADVLRADEAFVRSGQATIWLECNEDAKSLHLAEMLLSWDLPVFYFAFPAYNFDNANGAREAIFPMAYESGLLVAPRKSPVLSAHLSQAECILKPVTSVEDLRQALWRTPRWCLPQWERASRAELVALAAHDICCDLYDHYLLAGWIRGEFLPTRTERAERALAAGDAEIQRRGYAIEALQGELALAQAELARLRAVREAEPDAPSSA